MWATRYIVRAGGALRVCASVWVSCGARQARCELEGVIMFEQSFYPDIEPDNDMVCPKCKNPFWAMNVYEMETDYDIDESGLHRSDYVTEWQCDNCEHVFMNDEALSLTGTIEDEETDEGLRKAFLARLDQLKSLGLYNG